MKQRRARHFDGNACVPPLLDKADWIDRRQLALAEERHT
jgi:hypothetical protein